MLLVVEMIVVGLILHIVLDIGINLLGHHALKATFQQHTGWRLETIFQQQRIDSQIAGDVPALLDPMLAAREVR